MIAQIEDLVRVLNWQAIVADITHVQRLVHLVYRKGDDWIETERAAILKMVRQTYEMALEEEARSWGCNPGRVMLREGKELKALNERAKFSSKSIANTYNYDLARAIVAIGTDTPTANRYVYAHRLDIWDRLREPGKRQQIAMAETFWAINQAKADFYKHNALGERAEVAPYNTVCPICAAYVAGNPYRSMEDLYNKCQLPAHNSCPHFARAVTGRQLTTKECQELWLG